MIVGGGQVMGPTTMLVQGCVIDDEIGGAA